MLTGRCCELVVFCTKPFGTGHKCRVIDFNLNDIYDGKVEI